MKISEVNSVDEEHEDNIVRKITTDAHSNPFNNKKYILDAFDYAKTKQQTSPILFMFISKLVSNDGVTSTAVCAVLHHQHM